MPGLALIFENPMRCCCCALEEAKQCGSPYLYFLGLKTSAIKPEVECHRCKKPCGRKEAEQAAKGISELIKPEIILND